MYTTFLQLHHFISISIISYNFSPLPSFLKTKIERTFLEGTSNCLAEFEKNIETAAQIFLNFLHDLRGILPEIDKDLLCSFPTGVSQTWWNFTIGFYGKHLTFLSN